MLNLALWLKDNDFKPDQVQAFIPTPLAIASAMYHTELNPLKKISKNGESVKTPTNGAKRKLHKAFLRYHDPKNWDILRTALKRMGRSELIGDREGCLVPYSGGKITQQVAKSRVNFNHKKAVGKSANRGDFHHRIRVKK